MRDSSSLRNPLVPVILAGGSGTRLWPVSRSAFPKHLTELTGTGSMLQQTALRLRSLAAPERLVVVSAAGQATLVRRQLNALDAAATGHIQLEPTPRNTAAAVALAAFEALSAFGEDAILFVCPSDHLILAPERLFEAVDAGLPFAAAGRIITFGITPSRPDTGFGYIAAGESVDGAPGVRVVKRFVEKPPLAEAERMLAEGGHYWNSGMFLMGARTLIDELEAFEPEIASRAATAYEAGKKAAGEIPLGLFRDIPSMPVDKAVMERSQRVLVVPCDPRWSDVGSWQALWEIMDKDDRNNVIAGDAIIENGNNNLVKSEHRLVALAGVSDLAVIETADAILIADKANSEAVKVVVGRLAKDNRSQVDVHAREMRPWGSFVVLQRTPGVMVREVLIDEGASLDLQRHPGRTENWTIVEGCARTELDGRTVELGPAESMSVGRNVPHRLANAGHGPLRLIEVQTGEELGEIGTIRIETGT